MYDACTHEDRVLKSYGFVWIDVQGNDLFVRCHYSDLHLLLFPLNLTGSLFSLCESLSLFSKLVVLSEFGPNKTLCGFLVHEVFVVVVEVGS